MKRNGDAGKRQSNCAPARRARLPVALIGFATTLSCLQPAFADVVYLQRDRILNGKVVSESKQNVVVTTAEGTVTLPRSEVLRIARESPQDNTLRQVAGLLRSGKLDLAVTLYERDNLKAQFAPGTLEGLLLENCGDTAGAMMASSATATLLYRSLNLPDASTEIILFTAVLLSENGDHSSAARICQRIDLPPQRPVVWPGKSVAMLLERLTESGIRSQRGDLVAQSARLSMALTAARDKGPAAMAAVYAQIEALRQSKDYLRAVALFQPEHFLRRADIFVPLGQRVITGLLTAPDSPENLAALESAMICIAPYVDPEIYRAAGLNLTSRLLRSGRADAAQKLADGTAEKNPDLGATMEHLVHFHRQQEALGPAAHPLQRYQLAAWARGVGLLDESERLFREIAGDPRFSPNVLMQLELITRTRSQKTVARLRSLFDDGKFIELEAESQRFLETTPPPEFAAQARDLVQLAKFQTWSSKTGVASKAEAEFQQAERLAHRRDFTGALQHLNRLQLDSADTEAASKAAELRDKIVRAERLEQMIKQRENETRP